MSSIDEEIEPQRAGSNTPEPIGRRMAALARRYASPLLLVALLILIIGGLAILSSTQTGNRPLYPALPTLTPVSQELAQEAKVLDFTELNADPAAYRDQLIRVTGAYTPVPAPECQPWAGVPIRWSLVAEGLQLNATGFESILRFIDPGTELSVAGYWRMYQGPLGCGKQPAAGVVWYLEVIRIIEPNPLVIGGSNISLTVIANSPLPTLGSIEALTTLTPSLTPTSTETVEPLPTEPGIGIGTSEPTAIPTETATLAFPGTVTNTPDPDATPTPDTTPGVSVTPGMTATVSGSSTETPDPGLPTSTPSGTGYPTNATNTPTGGYP
jgi:hypothetical protein